MTRYYVGAWVDHRQPERGTKTLPETRTSKQAARRYAERVLPPGALYRVETLRQTVYTGTVPS